MKRYKLETSPVKGISEEEVSNYQDFGVFMANYNKALKSLHDVPLYKNPKALLGLLVIILVAWLVFQEVKKEEQQQNNRPETTIVE